MSGWIMLKESIICELCSRPKKLVQPTPKAYEMGFRETYVYTCHCVFNSLYKLEYLREKKRDELNKIHDSRDGKE